jgi:hypothetical protein
MLKFIYTETALYVELLTSDLEDWVTQRLRFANSTGVLVLISSGGATFLLPELLGEVTVLDGYLRQEGVETVTIHRCDIGHVEVRLTGYWFSPHGDSAEGVFVAQLPDRVESYLWQLWSTTHSLVTQVASYSE